jgi:hypothetical protein
MKTIRIDGDVWAALQERARPFEDSPNSVLRRVLKIDHANQVTVVPGTNGERLMIRRLPRGKLTPRSEFRLPLLQVLLASGGSLKVSEAVDKVGALMEHRFTEQDREKVRSGWIRWRSSVEWVRDRLVKEGLLKKDSPRGIWELTPKGVKAANSQGEQ